MKAADDFDNAFEKNSKNEATAKEQSPPGRQQGRERNQNPAGNQPNGRRG
jgi:hypothetical protein